jgi:hypothetical protein
MRLAAAASKSGTAENIKTEKRKYTISIVLDCPQSS